MLDELHVHTKPLKASAQLPSTQAHSHGCLAFLRPPTLTCSCLRLPSAQLQHLQRLPPRADGVSSQLVPLEPALQRWQRLAALTQLPQLALQAIRHPLVCIKAAGVSCVAQPLKFHLWKQGGSEADSTGVLKVEQAIVCRHAAQSKS